MKVIISCSPSVDVLSGWHDVIVRHVAGSSYILSCYFTNWAQYRPGAGKYLPTNIDPCLCDHLVYAFAGMDNNMITTYEWNDEKLYGQFQALKNELVHMYSHKKTHVSI